MWTWFKQLECTQMCVLEADNENCENISQENILENDGSDEEMDN